MRQTNVRGTLSLRGFRKLRTGAIVATGVILLGLGFLAPTVSANEQDGVWVARTVAEVKADLQKEGDLFKYVIKWGDTLSVISEASNIPVDVLQEMNQASGKNLFLPHNELYFTEAETVSDTVTKHKIVIKESGASGEVRTYEVLIKKDQETKALTFELTDVTEKVEKMAVNYSPVYQPVSVPIVESAEESVEELAPVSPVVTSPEVKEETEAPVVPKAEEAATTPAPKSEEKPATPAPKAEDPATPALKSEDPAVPAPKAEEPASTTPKAEEPVSPAPKAEDPATPAPKEEKPVTPAPKVEEPATPAPKEEKPATPAPKAEEPATPAPKEEKPATPAPKEEKPATPAPKEEKPATPAPKEEKPATPAPKEEKPATPAPKVEEPATPAPKVEEPVSSAPKVEEPATPAPKAEEPAAGTTPKSEESTAPAPKSDEPAASEPKVEEPATPAPKSDEPAASEPKVEEPATPAPKSDEPAVPAPKVEEPAAGTTPKSDEPAAGTTPKDDESASSVESPSTGNHSEESGAPSTTPTGDSTATQPSDSTSTPVTPSEEAPVTSGDTNSTTQPAGETGHSETTAEPSNTPSAEATNDSGSAATSGSVTDNTSSNTGTADQPVASNPSSEEPSAGTTPKAEEPSAGTTPKAEEPSAGTKEDAPSEEVAPKDEKLEEAKKDGKDVIEKIAASKLSEIEKVKDEAEKAKLEAKLKELKEAGLAAIKNAENHDAAVDATDEYQTKIDEINVPGEELPAPNYNKDNLTNGRNEGTTIENGSTAIGHGSGEATATAPTQPATETSSDSTPTAKPQPAATSETAASAASSFRNAPEVQVRARRVARAANQPEGTVNISYNYDGMPDINGFLSDPRENNTVAIPNSATEDEVKELVKAKIEAKAQELAKHGYKVKEKIVFEQDTNVKNFNYVVTFTKEKTGTSSFRNAPEVQVRTKKVVKRDLSNKTKKINIYYNLTALKDIAGALGELGEENMLTFPGNTPKEQLKLAIEEKTKAQIEKLKKQGFKVVSTTDLDQIVEGGDSYDYVVEFTKESKSTSANNSGFRKAPLVQNRAKRSVEQKETVDIHIYFNLKTLPGIAGALDVDGDTTIKLPKDASKEQVKEVIKDKIAKVEKRGYKVSDFYFGAKTERGYDFVVEFKK